MASTPTPVITAPTFSELPLLAGDGVTLRHITPADAAALEAIFGDPEVARYMGIPLLRSRADAELLLNDITAGLREGHLFQWGVVLPDSPDLAGTCTLAHISWPNERAEVGFALGSKHWRTGIMRRALPLLVDFAFVSLGLHRLEADVDPRNDSSLRLLQRLGFEREGYLQQRHLVAGERQDSVLLGLLATRWEGLRRGD